MPRRAKGPRLWFDEALRLWYVRDGTKKRGTGCGPEERGRAEEALQAYIAEKYEPVRSNRPDEVTVDDVLKFYLDEASGSHRSSTAAYSTVPLLSFWSGRKLNEIRRSSCREYVAFRTKQPISQARTELAKRRKVSVETVRRELGVLRAAIHAYHSEENLDAVPVVTIPEASAPRTRWLTRSEVAALLRACRRHPDKAAAEAMRRFILIGIYTGTRSGAIRSLGWMQNTEGGWIDLASGVMHRKAEAETESKKGKPSLKLPPVLYRHMRHWRQADGKMPWLIHDGSRRLDAQRKTWVAIRRSAGLGTDVTPHILRHTAVTWLMQSRAEPSDVASFVGMSQRMIEDVYLHHHPDFQDEVAAKAGKGRKRVSV